MCHGALYDNYWNVFSAWGNTGHLWWPSCMVATTWYRSWSLFLLPTAIILIFPIVHMLWYSRTLLVGIWVNRMNPWYICMHALHVGEFNSIYPNTSLWNSHAWWSGTPLQMASSFGPAFTLTSLITIISQLTINRQWALFAIRILYTYLVSIIIIMN